MLLLDNNMVSTVSWWSSFRAAMELDYCNSQYYNLSKSQVASNRVI